MITLEAETWVNLFPFRSSKCCKGHVPCVAMFRCITFAWWYTCDKHLIHFSSLVAKVKYYAIASNETVTNARGIKIVLLCSGLSRLGGFWDVSHERSHAVAIDELVGRMFVVL